MSGQIQIAAGSHRQVTGHGKTGWQGRRAGKREIRYQGHRQAGIATKSGVFHLPPIPDSIGQAACDGYGNSCTSNIAAGDRACSVNKGIAGKIDTGCICELHIHKMSVVGGRTGCGKIYRLRRSAVEHDLVISRSRKGPGITEKRAGYP